MTDPYSSDPKSSPRSSLLYASMSGGVALLILCFILWYFLSPQKVIEYEKIQDALQSESLSSKGVPVSLSAPLIAELTTEDHAIEQETQKRLELTDKEIKALSDYQQKNSLSSTAQ